MLFRSEGEKDHKYQKQFSASTFLSSFISSNVNNNNVILEEIRKNGGMKKWFGFGGEGNIWEGLIRPKVSSVLSNAPPEEVIRQQHKATAVSKRSSLTLQESITHKLLDSGLGPMEQGLICRSWMEGKIWALATKYKTVDKKVRPVNQPMPQHLNPPLQRPPLSRDPYQTPLLKQPPPFSPTPKVTNERIKMINFGPEGWLSE